MKEPWIFILEKLNQQTEVMLLVVIDNQGSSPGQSGFKMAVSQDGNMMGSIGGGQTEYRLVEKAKTFLSEEKPKILLKREVHRKEAEEDRSGMICSGEQWVAFYPVTQMYRSTVERILYSIENGESGMIHFDQNGFVFHQKETEHHKHKDPVTSSEEWIYSEPIGKTNQLYIFGAGHVGLALSNIASKVGFETHIFDDREQLNTLAENTSAETKHVIDYKQCDDLVPEGENIYVVIMTFGHKSDEIVLNQFLNKKVRYLGLMGSKKKIKSIFSHLKEIGVGSDTLEKIYAPIGVKISSQTPYEIAISIVAEMIAVKNN